MVNLCFHDSQCKGLVPPSSIDVIYRMLGKYSTIRKNVREFGELQTHVNTTISGSRKALVMDYCDMLNRHLLTPLENGNVRSGVERGPFDSNA